MHRVRLRHFLIGLAAAAGLLLAQSPASGPATVSRPQSTPATQPANIRDFAPGVRIDWTSKSVAVRGRVAQRDVPLEFLACFSGKEHESIVLLDASATVVYQALGLVGLTPGKPPVWDEKSQRFSTPEGDLVDVFFDFAEKQAAGGVEKTQRVPGLSWVREREFQRPARQRPFVFCDSRPGPAGKIAAESSGAGLALVDFSDSLLALREHFSSQNAELWAEADPTRVPPIGTPVTVVLQAAQITRPVIGIDFFGNATLNGRIERPADCIDAIQTWRLGGGRAPVVITVEAALESDRRQFARELLTAGIRDDWIEWARPTNTATTTAPASRPKRD